MDDSTTEPRKKILLLVTALPLAECVSVPLLPLMFLFEFGHRPGKSFMLIVMLGNCFDRKVIFGMARDPGTASMLEYLFSALLPPKLYWLIWVLLLYSLPV